MIEIALGFGWIAQTVVLLSAFILVMYKIISEDWDRESSPNKNEKPTGVIRQYISDFNSKKKLERNFHMPIMVLNSGKKNILKDISKLVDYKILKKTGWKYSTINSLDILSESDDTAIVKLNFYRVNKLNDRYLRANAYYTLTKQDSKWGISSMIIDADVPLGI